MVKETTDDEIRTRLSTGITIKSLAEELNMNYKSFAAYCKKHNIVKPDLVDWDKAKELYLSGMSCESVGKELRVSRSKVQTTLKAIMRPKQKSMFGLSPEDVQNIKRRYSEGESATKIAASLNLKHHNIERILKDEGVVLTGVDYSGNVNGHYFDVIDTEEKAYWLGFLAADGWISSKFNAIGLALNGKDIDHLNKFRTSVSLDQQIKWRKARDEVYVLFKSKQMYSRLIVLGFTPKKSQEFVPPKLIPSLEVHFWRGMVDGDGCISLSSTNYLSLDLSGTKEVVFAFVKFLNNYNIRTETPIDLKSHYRVNCWGFEASKALGVLYENSNVYLDRKHKLAVARLTSIGVEGCVNIGQLAAKSFFEKYHYLKTLPVGSSCYGWFKKGVLVGVAAFGSPTAPTPSKMHIGLKIVELRRFALSVNEPNLASKFLAATIKELKSQNKYDLLITFADGAQGHEGIIYKAIGMAQIQSSGRQMVGEINGAKLTGVHLDRHVAKFGIKDIVFKESLGKLKFSLDLR
jgi:hypothetical protein